MHSAGYQCYSRNINCKVGHRLNKTNQPKFHVRLLEIMTIFAPSDMGPLSRCLRMLDIVTWPSNNISEQNSVISELMFGLVEFKYGY